MSKAKVIAVHKLVGAIEKKVMNRRLDFWLPFRFQTAKKSVARYEEVKTVDETPFKDSIKEFNRE
jgi:hypothetical protein